MQMGNTPNRGIIYNSGFFFFFMVPPSAKPPPFIPVLQKRWVSDCSHSGEGAWSSTARSVSARH